jgi:signal transduction histidine kinase
MRCELLEMQERKNHFIMGISHDLRTPVAVIKGYSEAIKDGVISETEDIKKSIELIEQKSTQLEGMIDTLIIASDCSA